MRSIDNDTTIVLVLSCILKCGVENVQCMSFCEHSDALFPEKQWELCSSLDGRDVLRIVSLRHTTHWRHKSDNLRQPHQKFALGSVARRLFKTLAWLEITLVLIGCVLSRILFSGKNSKYPSTQDTAVTSDLGLICYYDLVIDSTLKRIVSPVIYWFRYRLNVSLFSLGLMHGSGWLKISSQLLLCAWEVV